MSIYDEIQAERVRQDAKWGEQNHPSADRVLIERKGGCSPERMCENYELPNEARAKWLCQEHERRGDISWPHIAVEEMSEAVAAFADGSEIAGRVELVQLAAVIVGWIECIDRNQVKL